MKPSYFTAVLTLTCLLGWGISAHAQDTGGVVVNIPFTLVAGDATLPAGDYRVTRVNTGTNQELEIRGYNNGGTFCSPCSPMELPADSHSSSSST